MGDTAPGGLRGRGDTGRLQHPESIANRLYQPAGTHVWGDAEATGANPREKEECQQTRRPAGHVISGTGQADPDKPPQGHPGGGGSTEPAVTQPSLTNIRP